MRQTGDSRTGYHPFLLDIWCADDLAAAFRGLVFQKCGEVTNSSTLLPSTFAKYTGRPEKYLSLHFANSIWKNNLTEVMAQNQTDGTAGALALAGTGLMGCSVGGASAGDASTASNELTDEQKKLHKQIVAIYNVEKQAAIKEQLDADYAAGNFDETAPFVKADPFGTDTLSCYVRFATSRAGITSRQTPRDRARAH